MEFPQARELLFRHFGKQLLARRFSGKAGETVQVDEPFP
jgi:hypothetical protein